MQHETSQDIDEQAAAWVAHLDAAAPTPAGQARLERWLDGDPRCRGALLRASALMMYSESAIALGPDYAPEAFLPPRTPAPRAGSVVRARVSRRRLLGWGMAAACVATVGLIPALSEEGVLYATELGEMRLIPLEDGSTVTLNTASRIRVHYDDMRRQVTLLQGEAWFEPTSDAARPFQVKVDGRILTAEHASFLVRKLDSGPAQVSVHGGRVALADGGIRALHPLQRVVLHGRENVVPERVSQDELDRELAWREGKIAFRGERLDEAAIAFARYSRTRIVVADPALAGERVTGLFASSDPVGFGHAVAEVFHARSRVVDGEVLISRAH